LGILIAQRGGVRERKKRKEREKDKRKKARERIGDDIFPQPHYFSRTLYLITRSWYLGS
jgi:hypothetical protein